MRIGKVHGRTETRFSGEGSGLVREIRQSRSIEAGFAGPPGDENTATPIPRLALENERLLIGQWISAIDKTITKPGTGKPSGKQFREREALGQACWELLLEKAILPEDQKDYWEQRLHPYGRHDVQYLHEEKGTKWKGRWYKAFWAGDGKHAETARRIFRHLHEVELRQDGKAKYDFRRSDAKKAGLIKNRALSAERSVFDVNNVPDLHPCWDADDVKAAYFRPKDDVAARIRKKLAPPKGRSGTGRPVKPSKVVGELLSEHLSKVTGSSRCSYLGEDTENTAPDPRVLALHNTIRGFYKRLVKGVSADKLRKKLPENSRDLLRVLRQQHKNRMTSQLVRFGRVVCYSRGTGSLENAETWTSAGQARIKEEEAFVRVWRGSITRAARAVKAWLDPAGEVVNSGSKEVKDADITSSDNIKKILGMAPLLENALKRSPLYFGTDQIFSGLSPEDQKDIFNACLRYLASCRHRTFHYGTRSELISKLSKKLADTSGESGELSDAAQQAIQGFLERDQEALITRLLTDLKAADVHRFTGNADFSKLFSAIQDAAHEDVPDVILPGFKRLLRRAGNLREYIVSSGGIEDVHAAELPEEPNLDDLHDPALKARYAGLMALYAGPFRAYIGGLGAEDLAPFIDRVNETTTLLARSAHTSSAYPDAVRARAGQLPGIAPSETIIQYFSRLVQVTAQEFEVQLGYNSSSAQAREQAEFIENFKRDFIALIFEDYLKKHGFDWLPAISKGQSPTNPTPEDEDLEIRPCTKQNESWQAGLYLILHFVPFDDVSRLLHQFKRWGALQGKYELERSDTATAEAQVNRFKDTLNLYLKMHDGKIDGSGTDVNLSQFRPFYQSPEIFNDIFLVEDNSGDAERIRHTRKGLRHVLRYNHVPAFENIFKEHPVSSDDVSELQNLEQPQQGDEPSLIQAAHTDRATIHDKVMKARGKKTISEEDQDIYRKALHMIEEHKALVGRVYFGDHVRLHRLVMMVLGRLIDFAGLWERDCKNKKGFIHRGIKYLNERRQADLQSWQHPKGGDIGKIRHDLAHFNVLDDRDADQINLTEQVNRVRDLMSYDRKLRNAVSGSIIEMMNREGIGLSWEMQGHRLHRAKISAEPITHFKNVKNITPTITERRHNPAFLEMVAKVFGGVVQADRNPPEQKQGTQKGTSGPRSKPINPALARGREFGVITKYFDDKGYGFIIPDRGGPDVFFHQSVSGVRNPVHLDKGQRVSYELEKGRDGRMQATRMHLETSG